MKPPKPSISIPRSPLGDDLATAAHIRREMTGLLQKLESQVAGRPIAKPGSWRHHPADWPKDPRNESAAI